MPFKKQPEFKKPPRVYCGQCEQGWVMVKTGDPLYPTAARACGKCNSELGRHLHDEHLQKMATEPNYRAGELASRERIKMLSREEALEVFPRSAYVPPSKRGLPKTADGSTITVSNGKQRKSTTNAEQE